MNKNINGFTIVEMLITIVIIGILMTIGITSFSNIRTEVQDQDKLSKATVISQALENYYEKHGEYPDCNQIVGVSSTDASSTLDDIDPNIFASPQTLDGTNSITSCVVDPEIDTFSYIVTSDKSQYILKYREKSTNTVKEIASRHGSTYTLASPSSSPTTNVSLLVNDVIATVSTVSCTSGTPYYSISSRINDGTWSSWSHWSSTITTSQQTANDGIKYGYRAQAKCYSSDTQTSRSVIGSEATYIDPISTPSAPVVTANNVGDNTTWSWPAVTCTAGSPSYQYVYTISPSGYSSGTMPYKSNLLTFTTSTAEQTYAVSVQAKCSNAYTSSGWSEAGSASFYQPPVMKLKKISAGRDSTCGISMSDTVYCWGLNDQGQLGNNSTTNSPIPVAVDTSGTPMAGKVIQDISLGWNHTCALDTTGLVYCWGNNSNGQLGDYSTSDRLKPVAVYTSGVLSGKTIQAIAAGTQPVGNGHTCALDTDGKVYCWGYNANGQLGNSSTTQRTYPVAVTTSGVLSGKVIKAISAGDSNSHALSTDGLAYAWGYNVNGELGNNSTTRSLAPVATRIISSVTAISNTLAHSCALNSSGVVYCWGDNISGKIGDGTTTDRLIPVTVSTAGTPMVGKTIQAISAGGTHSCAVDTAGLVYCWGSNSDEGQLGNNSTSRSLVPVAVDTSGLLVGKAIQAISAGYNHTCAIDTNNSAYCWGNNYIGQIGDNSTTDRLVPVYVYPA